MNMYSLRHEKLLNEVFATYRKWIEIFGPKHGATIEDIDFEFLRKQFEENFEESLEEMYAMKHSISKEIKARLAQR